MEREQYHPRYQEVELELKSATWQNESAAEQLADAKQAIEEAQEAFNTMKNRRGASQLRLAVAQAALADLQNEAAMWTPEQFDDMKVARLEKRIEFAVTRRAAEDEKLAELRKEISMIRHHEPVSAINPS